MKVVPVDMREIDKVRFERVDQSFRHWGIIPPRTPVGTAYQPGIADETHFITSDRKTRMRKDLEFHIAGSSS